MQHAYVSITEIDRLNFSSCEGCRSSCCDGARFLFAPLILEDFEEVYRHFPIVFGNIVDEWRALLLFSVKDGPCRYYKEGACEIYAHRPPACRLYPLTPFYEDVLIDTSCHAISSEQGKFLASKEQISSDFYHKRLEGFEVKLQETQAYLNALGESFEPLSMIGGIAVCGYRGEKDDEFLQMHRSSLELL